jgi:hypothetical protein
MKKHDRQSFLGPNSEQTLRSLRVAIIGLGGGGSHISQQLAHVGIGNLFIFDPDTIDEEGTNLNRLIGGTEADVAAETPKVEIARRLISGIDSKIEVRPFQATWQDHLEILRTADIIIGCVDSLLQRRDLESFARRFLIPYIDIGMDVYESTNQFAISGQVALSMPGEPCMICLGILRNDLLAEEAGRYGDAGSLPQVVWSNGVLASAAVGVLMQLVTPWSKEHPTTILLEYDGNSQTLKPSMKLEYIDQIKCNHYSGSQELGDPFLN